MVLKALNKVLAESVSRLSRLINETFEREPFFFLPFHNGGIQMKKKEGCESLLAIKWGHANSLTDTSVYEIKCERGAVRICKCIVNRTQDAR